MGPLLVALFLVVPLAELAVIAEVSDRLGLLDTIAVLVLVSLAGAWLVKREGLGVWHRVHEQVANGRVPGRELLDGAIVLVAGALLLTPGFLTDIVGLLLLLPPVRAAVAATARRRFGNRVEVVGIRSGSTRVIDIEALDDDA